MKLPTRKKTPTEQLKDAAIEAALNAFEARPRKSSDRPPLAGIRAVATGAVLYTAGRAVVKGTRVVHERRATEQAEADADSSAKSATPTPRPASRKQGPGPRPASRKQGRRPRPATRKQEPRPSLDLPRQRWPRMAAARR